MKNSEYINRADLEVLSRKPKFLNVSETVPNQYDIRFIEHNLFRLFKVKSSPISISIDHGLIYRLIMLLRDKDAELFGAIDPQSTFLNRLQQDNDSRRNMCYFEVHASHIFLGEVHASLYKVSTKTLVNSVL